MGGEVGNLFWKISVFRYSAVNVWDSREERYRLRNIKFIFTIRIRNPEAKLFLALNSGSKWNFPFKDFAICFHMISVGKWEKWEKQNLCLQSRFLSEKKKRANFLSSTIQRQFTAKARRVYDGERGMAAEAQTHCKLGFMGHDYLFLIFYGETSTRDKRSPVYCRAAQYFSILIRVWIIKAQRWNLDGNADCLRWVAESNQNVISWEIEIWKRALYGEVESEQGRSSTNGADNIKAV